MKNSKKIFLALLLVAGITLSFAAPVLAQTQAPAEYRLNLNRDFGFGAGANIRGLFSLNVVGPEGYTSVSYYIDGNLMATVPADPFKFQFNTSQYDFGWHDLNAEVTASNGSVFTTPARHVNFVDSAVESQAMKNILFPIFGVLGVIILIIVIAQVVVFRNRTGKSTEPGLQRNYGIMGGAICSKCGRPTPRHIWGMNIMVGKLDRCENCGKWSIMRAMPLDMLRAAEEAEKASDEKANKVVEKSADEQLKEMLEKSKYE
jgi:hypothetical protein